MCRRRGLPSRALQGQAGGQGKRTDQEIARAKADVDANIAAAAKFYDSVYEVAKGSIDRTRASAELVQKGAAAIVTLYAGILALSFSVAENPLPVKALYPAVLLGMAIILSTAFLAYLPDVEDEEREESARERANAASLSERFANTFIVWTKRAALRRGRLLRGSVIALAGAVVMSSGSLRGVRRSARGARGNRVAGPRRCLRRRS